MDEYIEREALLEKISRMIDYCEKDRSVNGLTALFQVGDAIIDCKAADVAPVVHGRWIERRIPNDTGTLVFVCSACGGKPEWTKRNYCPNCGAKMDGGTQ